MGTITAFVRQVPERALEKGIFFSIEEDFDGQIKSVHPSKKVKQKKITGFRRIELAPQRYLARRLEEVRKKHKVPALAAAIMKEGRLLAASATGFRRFDNIRAETAHFSTKKYRQADSKEKVEPNKTLAPHSITSSKFYSRERVRLNDAFHLGSITKPITATLLGILINQGRFKKWPNWHGWDTTLGEFFPELVNRKIMKKAYRDVTISQLFAHIGKVQYMPSTEKGDEFAEAAQSQSLRKRRYEYVKAAVIDKPETEQTYSGGAIIAAAMMERVMNQKWETLMKKYVFEPMGMKTAGFGAMSSRKFITGVWEHYIDDNTGRITYFIPPDDYDKEVHAPAGRNVHCSVIDLAKFLNAHLGFNSRRSLYLTPRILNTLHTIVEHPWNKKDFCHGAWVRKTKTNWFGDEVDVLRHSGSNNRNLARGYIVPGKNVVFCVMTNIADKNGVGACAEMESELIQIVRYADWKYLHKLNDSLACGKKVKASNVYKNSPNYKAENAVDGALGSRWATDGSSPWWFKINLGSVHSIGKIIICEEYGNRAKGFKIQYRDKEDRPWRTIKDGSGIGCKKEFDTDFKARIVRLLITSGKAPTISEFLLFPPKKH